MSENVSIWNRLANLDSRVVYLLYLGIMFVIALQPIGLPLQIGEQSTITYNFIEDLPPGSTVGYLIDLDAMAWMQGGPPGIAYGNHVFEKDFKVIMWSTVPDAVSLTIKTLDIVQPEEKFGKVYGEDYIYLGYAAGGPAAISSAAEDLKATYGGKDYKENDLDQFPIMEGINTAEDFDLIIVVASGIAETYVSFWYEPYGTPITTTQPPMVVSGYIAYQKAGQIVSVLSGLRDGAEYETLIGYPGLSIAAMDQASAATLLLLGFIIIGNISMFMSQRSEEN
jgi:hypothetical protein